MKVFISTCHTGGAEEKTIADDVVNFTCTFDAGFGGSHEA